MLPNSLKFQSKIESSASRSTRNNIQAQNGTGPYNVNDTIIINIPTRANLCLVPAESYLKFRVNLTNNSGAANTYARWDACGAHGVIQRLRVFHGSNLLSDIDNYAMLAKILMDAQVPTDATYGKYSILAGTRSDLVAASGTTGSVLQIKGGRRIGGGTSGLAIAATVSEYYCINLISLVGSLCAEKYIPLFAMTSAPLRVEIQLVQNTLNCICSDTALTMTLDKVEYVANMLEISDQAIEIINQSLNGQPLQFVVPDFRNFQSTFNVSSGSSSVFIPIPAKYSSLKALYVAARDSTKIGVATFFPMSTNVFNLANYTFRIGPNVMPSKAPESIPEYFSEAVKAIGSMSNLNHQPSIEIDSYSQNLPTANNDSATTTGTINSGAFVVGVDLESFPNADKTSLFAGHCTNTDDIYFNGNYSGLAAATTLRYDSFANFDAVLVFENSTCYVKF